MCPCRPAALAAALVLAAVLPPPAAAQPADTADTSQPGWSLARTMREFSNDVGNDVLGYFPTRGEWEWVTTVRYPNGTRRRHVHRFPAAQAEAALGPGGPVCHAFSAGDVAVLGTVIAPDTGFTAGSWRRVGATRFVPPRAPASSPVFVEWRREDARWVVAAFGENGSYREPRTGTDPFEAVRGPRGAPLRLPLPDSARVVAGLDWHRHNIPIVVSGIRRDRYSSHRLKEGDVERWGSVQGVGVYVEAGSDHRKPEVVYLPVDREGTFASYQNMTGGGC